jgi:hypothetical protein
MPNVKAAMLVPVNGSVPCGCELVSSAVGVLPEVLPPPCGCVGGFFGTVEPLVVTTGGVGMLVNEASTNCIRNRQVLPTPQSYVPKV